MKAFAFSVALAICLTTSLCALDFRTVVLTGEAAPGTAPGITFGNVSSAAISDSGEVAFSAFVTGPGVDQTQPGGNSSGTWSEGGGVLRKVERQGDAALGISPATTFGLSSVPRINASGQSAFLVNVGILNQDAIYSEGSGSLEMIARESDQAPGMSPGVNFQLLGVPVINDLGQVAFEGILDDPNSSDTVYSVWTNRSGPLTLAARTGEPVEGTTTTLKGIDTILLNDSGYIGFTGYLQVPGLIRNAWTDANGTLTEVMRDGQQAFGFPAGVTYGSLRQFKLNNAGHIAFGSTLTGPGTNPTNNLALWEGPVDDYRIVVQTGSQAPGLDAGLVFSDFKGTTLNGVGGLAFVAGVSGPGVTAANDTGVWNERAGALQLVAREGDRAPGTPSGHVFNDLSILGVNFEPFANKLEQVAFVATLAGPGVTTANDRGIWATDLSGQLRLIAREGDQFDLNDDPLVEDLRTVTLVQLTSGGNAGEDGRQSAFNGAGQLAIRISFAGGSSPFLDGGAGIFVVETAVPEPASLSLAALTLVGCGMRRR